MIFFKENEFQCKCGKCGLGYKDMDEDYLLKLDQARGYAEVPFNVNSAVRCLEHNKKEKGTPTSSHLKGCATDIDTPNSFIRYRVVTGLMRAGITRFVVYPTFVHNDDDHDKPKELMSRKGE
jgi:zinc D-Ala-D-Ala carboxypeptidase